MSATTTKPYSHTLRKASVGSLKAYYRTARLIERDPQRADEHESACEVRRWVTAELLKRLSRAEVVAFEDDVRAGEREVEALWRGRAPVPIDPALADRDLMVLRAFDGLKDGEERTLWQLGEEMDVIDLRDVSLTLDGLQVFGYVQCGAVGRRRRTLAWWRTQKGHDAATR